MNNAKKLRELLYHTIGELSPGLTNVGEDYNAVYNHSQVRRLQDLLIQKVDESGIHQFVHFSPFSQSKINHYLSYLDFCESVRGVCHQVNEVLEHTSLNDVEYLNLHQMLVLLISKVVIHFC